MPVDDESVPVEPRESPAPFSPEDVGYQGIVSEYLGLRRAGAPQVDAALITAAHLMVLGLANTAAKQAPGGV